MAQEGLRPQAFGQGAATDPEPLREREGKWEHLIQVEGVLGNSSEATSSPEPHRVEEAMIAPFNNAWRNRWISPRQVKILHTLWSAKLRRAGRRPRPERAREERLGHIAEIVGHAVASSRELNWREANRVIHRLLEEVRVESLSPSGGAAPGAEAEAGHGRALSAEPAGLPFEGSVSKDLPSDAQLWKIRQIEQYLGWGRPGKDERRLAGFLQKKFHVDQPEELTADSASSVIEALCAVGARQRIKARKGKAYAVKRAELTREVARLKHELQEWRPAES